MSDQTIKTSNFASTPAHAVGDTSLNSLIERDLNELAARINDLEARVAQVQPATVIDEAPAPFTFNLTEDEVEALSQARVKAAPFTFNLTEEDADALTAAGFTDMATIVIGPDDLSDPTPAYRHHPQAPAPDPEPDPEPTASDAELALQRDLVYAHAAADIEDVHRRALAEVTSIATSAGLLVTFYDFPQFTEGGSA